MRRGRFIPTTAFGFLMGGCGGAGPLSDDAPLVLTAADLHVVGTSDSLAVAEDVAVLEDGTVWVQNSVEPLFLAFDGGGAGAGPVAVHGRLGGGPRELGAPAGFVVGGLEGEAWTLDLRRHLLVRVSAPGEPRAELPLPENAIPRGSVLGGMSLMNVRFVRTARLRDEIILPRRRAMGEVSATEYWMTIWDADLVALDAATGRSRTVISLPDVMGDLDAHFADVSAGFPPFPFWYRLWAVCGNEIRIHDFVRNQLRGFAPDGTEIDPVTLPPPPFTEATPRQFVRAVFDMVAAERAGAVTPGVGTMSAADSAQLIEGAVARLEGSPAQHAAILPQYVDFRCDERGVMWLRPMDLEAGGMRGGRTWLRIDRAGIVREVRFPDRFDPWRFKGDRAWGVVRDELDVAAVGWVAVP